MIKELFGNSYCRGEITKHEEQAVSINTLLWSLPALSRNIQRWFLFCSHCGYYTGVKPSRKFYFHKPLQWRHNGRDCVSNHQPHDCLLNRLIRRRSKKTSKLRVTVLCAGNSLGTGEFPAQMGSNAENVSIWWRHDAFWHCFAHWRVIG